MILLVNFTKLMILQVYCHVTHYRCTAGVYITRVLSRNEYTQYYRTFSLNTPHRPMKLLRTPTRTVNIVSLTRSELCLQKLVIYIQHLFNNNNNVIYIQIQLFNNGNQRIYPLSLLLEVGVKI